MPPAESGARGVAGRGRMKPLAAKLRPDSSPRCCCPRDFRPPQRTIRGMPSGLRGPRMSHGAAGRARVRQVSLPLPSSVRSAAGLLRGHRPSWLSPKVFRTEALGRPRRGPGADSRGDLVLDHRRRRPAVGLFASFTMAVVISFVGGRPAMISAATGAVALVIAPSTASTASATWSRASSWAASSRSSSGRSGSPGCCGSCPGV